MVDQPNENTSDSQHKAYTISFDRKGRAYVKVGRTKIYLEREYDDKGNSFWGVKKSSLLGFGKLKSAEGDLESKVRREVVAVLVRHKKATTIDRLAPVKDGYKKDADLPKLQYNIYFKDGTIESVWIYKQDNIWRNNFWGDLSNYANFDARLGKFETAFEPMEDEEPPKPKENKPKNDNLEETIRKLQDIDKPQPPKPQAPPKPTRPRRPRIDYSNSQIIEDGGKFYVTAKLRGQEYEYSLESIMNTPTTSHGNKMTELNLEPPLTSEEITDLKNFYNQQIASLTETRTPPPPKPAPAPPKPAPLPAEPRPEPVEQPIIRVIYEGGKSFIEYNGQKLVVKESKKGELSINRMYFGVIPHNIANKLHKKNPDHYSAIYQAYTEQKKPKVQNLLREIPISYKIGHNDEDGIFIDLKFSENGGALRTTLDNRDKKYYKFIDTEETNNYWQVSKKDENFKNFLAHHNKEVRNVNRERQAKRVRNLNLRKTVVGTGSVLDSAVIGNMVQTKMTHPMKLYELLPNYIEQFFGKGLEDIVSQDNSGIIGLFAGLAVGAGVGYKLIKKLVLSKKTPKCQHSIKYLGHSIKEGVLYTQVRHKGKKIFSYTINALDELKTKKGKDIPIENPTKKQEQYLRDLYELSEKKAFS